VGLKREKYKEQMSSAHGGNHSPQLHSHTPRSAECTGSTKGDRQSPVGSDHTKAPHDRRDRAARIDHATTQGRTKSSQRTETPGNAAMVPSFFILLKRRSAANTALGNI